ncbi:hypothetical protein JL722_10525 [Aureococcus anophagefferens]|nr:hypothetical protein JL722_10525 [Aureococcus anophagefferens]
MLHARRFVARCPLRAALTRCSSSSHDAFDEDARRPADVELPRPFATSPLQKAFAAGASALRAIANPERADMADAARLRDACAPGTFGRAYGAFMGRHGFDADDRSPVTLVDDEELACVLLRYRQVHDYWHVLFGLPPSIPGELALKWFELVHTGLPVAAFSAVFGPVHLSGDRASARSSPGARRGQTGEAAPRRPLRGPLAHGPGAAARGPARRPRAERRGSD